MRVLGVDPGYDRLGVAILEKKRGVDILIYSDCITTDKSLSFPERLFIIGKELSSLLVRFDPDSVALEKLFFNKNQKTAIAVAEVRGMIIYLARLHKCRVQEYTPQQIKVAVTGYGKSDKKQVAYMVKQLLSNVKDNALDDEYDAIATGLTALSTSSLLST